MNRQIQSKQHHRHQSIRKLERRNAIKNIDYDAATSSSPSSIVVIPSFRVEGIEGDFDLICRSLGLSGPEDFAIPAAAWEARKSPQGFNNNNNNRNSKSCELSSSFEAKVNEKGNSKSCELVNNPDSEDFRAKVGDRENKRNEKGVDGQISRSFLLVNSTKLEDFRAKVSDRENRGNEKRVNGRNSRSCVLVNDRKKDSLRDGLLNTVVAKLRFSESERSEKRPDSADLGFCEWPSIRNPEKVGVTENERDEVRTNQNLRLCESVDDRDHEKPRVKGSNVDDLLNTIENKGNRNVFTQAQIGVRVRECDEVKCQLSNNQNSIKSGVSSSNGDDVLNSLEDRVKVGNEGNENELETVVGDKNLHEVKCELGSYQNLENSRIIDSNTKISSRTFESNVRVRESKRIEYDFVPANIDFRAKRTGESRNGNKELSIDSGRGKNRISVRSFRGGIKGARPPLLAPPTVIPPSQQTDNTNSDDFINVDENWFTKAEIGVRVKDCDKVECELANSQNPDNSWVTSSNNNDLLDTLEDKVRGENKGNENVFTRAEIDVRVGDCNEILDSDRAISSETFEPNIRVRERNSIENEFAPTKIEIMVRRTDESFSMRSFRGGIKGARPPLLAPPPVISPSQQTDNMGSSWDLLRSFGPPDDEDSNSYIGNSIQENEMTVEPIEGVGKQRRDVYGEWLGDIRVVSESCSDTSEDRDDDFTNVKMEPLHFVSPLGKFKCTINSWQKGDFLGSGSFGTVYEGFTDDGIFFAVKEVSLLDQGDQGKQSIYQLEQEIFFLSQFEHENIVQYLGTDKDSGKLYIFLELVTKGSLASLYQKYNLQDSQVSAYTRQILNGLNYLHLRKVVHRDIKCANILVDASGSVKLADFGLAKATNLNDVKSCKGTAFWMAPEVVNRKNHGYGLAADIWSLGCTVLEMLTRRIPYSHLEGMQALFRIGKGEPPLVPNSLSREARDFISKCLRVNPDDRPTAAQLLNHPFVKRPLTLSAPTSPFQHGRRS